MITRELAEAFVPDLERGPVLVCGPEPMTTAMRVRRQYDDSNADCECILFKESQTDHDRIALVRGRLARKFGRSAKGRTTARRSRIFLPLAAAA